MTRWTVAVFEFQRYFKWKQELVSLGLMILTVALMSAWPLIKGWVDKDYKVALVSELAAPKVDGYSISQIRPEALDNARAGLGEVWDLLVLVEGDQLRLVAQNSASWQDKLVPELQRWLQQQLIAAMPLEPAQKAMVQQLPKAEFEFLHKDSREQNKQQQLIGGGILILLSIGVFSGFGFMFTAITSEKQQRVTEQLLTLITPSQWIDGKILGISLFCLKTMLTTGLFMLVVIQAVRMLSDKALFALPLQPLHIVLTLVFVMLGLLLINSFMAGFAATIDDPNHSSRSVVMFLPGLPLFLVFSAMDNIEGGMMQFLSWFPLTSYAAMPMRMASTDVAWWQWLGSLLVLVAFLYWARAAAARIFELGIRMYGKEPDWSVLLKTFLVSSR
ncbi:ABC transporter permease [Rheinheimera sp.]|uniref:ABC transporter permease n=1 Tax=Rheinheimera sp. TaxID=1869214 RepID=UPI00307E284E